MFLRNASRPAASLEPATTPPKVTAIALENTARGEAASMREDGALLGATLAEGERATVPVTLAAGECATFIAQGGIGLVEVDLFLTAEGRSEDIFAQDLETGHIAVIGGRDACFSPRGAGALSATLHVQVRRGAGVVLARGYRRARAETPATSAASARPTSSSRAAPRPAATAPAATAPAATSPGSTPSATAPPPVAPKAASAP
ncbi:uncharacterized protein CMC5_031010 [Chondromyces crocatus]|uniref:Uncharacterized protein n=2 Tax=Chondromyces crocatus TaxID=52 RepID=A0A0K1EDM4_CHOCO|nr:uncharacterized protein CMC5_031010 [Chondromyces crocatus]